MESKKPGELGKKLREARMEAGLSQRQLCGEEITRNMLSQIENGRAQPSMGTLQYLAGRLGKTVGYFLGEEEPEKRAQQALAAEAALKAGAEAIAAGKYPYARQLLEPVPEDDPALRRQKWLLLGQIPGADLQEICRHLPSLDEELLLRAGAALAARELDRCLHLLEAAQERGQSWYLLRGRLSLAMGEFPQAAEQLHRAEERYPQETAPLLETCYREMEDYKTAYFYACKQKG